MVGVSIVVKFTPLKLNKTPFIRLYTLATLDIAPKSNPKNKIWP
jgi:hypothetical protein